MNITHKEQDFFDIIDYNPKSSTLIIKFKSLPSDFGNFSEFHLIFHFYFLHKNKKQNVNLILREDPKQLSFASFSLL
jgi:hypothetical protein